MNNAFWTAAAELQWKVLMNELTWKVMCINSNTIQEEERKKTQVYHNWTGSENWVMLVLKWEGVDY